MTQPVVMFGLGATKAGTSWLHTYLAGHPDCAMPAIKELHYFDWAEGDRMTRRAAFMRDKRAQIAAQAEAAIGARRAMMDRQVAAHDAWVDVLDRGQVDAAAYMAFLTRDAAGRRLVGDMTPAYGLLPEAMLTQMAKIAPVTRFVYLLRDPVNRLWSHLRMLAGRQAGRAGDVQDHALRLFDEWVQGGHGDVSARGDYATILPRLQRSLPAGSLLTEFYEHLFSDAAVERLCAFLGIAPKQGDFSLLVHASPKARLDPVRAETARRLLAPQYDAVAQALGALPQEWTTNLRKGAA